MSFKSSAETGQQLWDPDIGRELKTEKSCNFADRLLFALRDGETRSPAEVVQQSDWAGVCALTNVWR